MSAPVPAAAGAAAGAQGREGDEGTCAGIARPGANPASMRLFHLSIAYLTLLFAAIAVVSLLPWVHLETRRPPGCQRPADGRHQCSLRAGPQGPGHRSHLSTRPQPRQPRSVLI